MQLRRVEDLVSAAGQLLKMLLIPLLLQMKLLLFITSTMGPDPILSRVRELVFLVWDTLHAYLLTVTQPAVLLPAMPVRLTQDSPFRPTFLLM